MKWRRIMAVLLWLFALEGVFVAPTNLPPLHRLKISELHLLLFSGDSAISVVIGQCNNFLQCYFDFSFNLKNLNINYNI